MSPAVVAALLGVSVGVVIERIARLIGLLSCEASVQVFSLTDVKDAEGYERRVWLERADATMEPEGAVYWVTVDLFNSKEVGTGLRDVWVELVRDDGTPMQRRAEDLGTGEPLTADLGFPPGTMGYDDLKFINLPPRQFVHKELRVEFGKSEAEVLKDGRWRSIDLVGQFPSRPILGILGSKTYRKTITDPKDYRPRGG